MKFARYLEDTQTPEWKKAYIDYRGLKKQLTSIRRSQPQPPFAQSINQQQPEPELRGMRSSSSSRLHRQDYSTEGEPSSSRVTDIASVSRRSLNAVSQTKRALSQPALHSTNDSLGSPHRATKFGTSPELARPGSSAGQRRIPSLARGSLSRKRRLSQPRVHPFVALPLHELLAQLSSEENNFFDMLDVQLEKIETFYHAREKETHARSEILREQLNELSEHKKIVQAAYPKVPRSWYSKFLGKVKEERAHVPESRADGILTVDQPRRTKEKESGGSGDEDEAKDGPGKRERLSSDPEDYHHAKKKLKKAVLEHYRELEALHNYRILNITGFRKSLKKFEKLTKITAQQYMTERVEKSAFASDKAVSTLMMDMQNLYATVFVRGDRKRAMRRLHAGILVKSHHFSTFRSGIFIGLALPAFVSGLYHSFQQRTRDAIPGWDGLLFVYGMLLIPVVFAMLIGVNLSVWSSSRINYVFIFELDTRTRLDYQQYYETPSILLAGLCYAFWLSFQRIGAPSLSPTIWPLIWLGFAFIVVVNPLPLVSKPSRYWLLKHAGKLLVPGARRVEFTDFWLGDQFCSLIFTISNLYLFCCVYANGFDSNWKTCASSSPRWPVQFLLAALPLAIRVVQSVRRYIDSKLVTHLINGGKYASGTLGYLFFYIWRHQGGRGTIFALWCLFNTIYSIYASSWDLLMDWSVLRPRARYPFLRDELIYSNSIPLYYAAIILNLLIRFIWVFYIPEEGPNIMLRTFIAALLEVFRRWQWNFYRLENEHIGNMDQYRATREVPLPYSLEDSYSKDSEDEDDSDIPRSPTRR